MQSVRSFGCPIERLESRIAPAVVFAVGDFNGDGNATDLRVIGDGKNQTMLISEGATTTVSLDANGDGDLTDATDKVMDLGFSASYVEVNLGAGNDKVVWQLTAAQSARTKNYFFELGPGNNAFTYKGDKFIIANGSDFAIDVQGGKGNDALDITFGQISGSRLQLTGNLGAGRDAILTPGQPIKPSQITFTGVGAFGANADVRIDLDLGPGSNLFEMNATSAFGFAGNDGMLVDVLITGSNGARDIDQITMNVLNGPVFGNSDVRFRVDLQGGNDRFTAPYNISTIYLARSADSQSQNNFVPHLSLDVSGGAGNDVIEIDRQSSTGTSAIGGVLALSLRGGSGNDTLKADLGSVLNDAELGGAGLPSPIRLLQLRLDGGIGNDSLNTVLVTDTSAAFAIDAAFTGGSGTDTISFKGEDNSDLTSFGFAGAVLVSGGSGTDAITVEVTGIPVHRVN